MIRQLNREPGGAGKQKYLSIDAMAPSARSARTRVSRSETNETDQPSDRLGELAYRRILEALFDRRISAGSFKSQNELVSLLDVPVHPLREALRVLETEGLLKIHARSGIEFLKADLELARSTYQFRSIIERSAVRTYAETAEASDIAKLIADHQALLALVQSIGATDAVSEAMEELEQRFHGSLIAALRNPMIETTARRLKNHVTVIRLDVTATAPRVMRTIREHLEVLEACEARDPEKADAALGLHFQAALQRILGMS